MTENLYRVSVYFTSGRELLLKNVVEILTEEKYTLLTTEENEVFKIIHSSIDYIYTESI